MALSQDVSDYLEAVGGQVGAMGLPSRRYSSPLETGLSSALSGFSAGSKFKRAMGTARKLDSQKKAFEAKTGMSYDLFVKLGSAAQQEILKHSGVVADPYSQNALPDFGGRTAQELDYGGAPGRTDTVPRGTGVFSGLGDTTVQVGPPLPPLKSVGAGSRAGLMDRYLGVEAPVSEKDQSLIDYRTAGAKIRGAESTARIDLMKKRGDLAVQQTAATRALAANRGKADVPAPDWMVQAGRRLGLMLPEGVPVTKGNIETMLKFNRPAQAVILRISDLVEGARDAELKAGKQLSDEQLARYVKMQTTELGALAGPTASQIVLDAVKSQMATLRSQAEHPPADEGDHTVDEGDLPPEYDDTQDELEVGPNEEDDSMESGYSR